jgi:hypothetical protein
MTKLRPPRPSASMIVAIIALVAALGGTSYAAFSLPKNSVGTKQLKKNAVTTPKIKNGAVTAGKINPAGLTVPSATNANHATNATNATDANHASTANTAATVGPLASGQTERGDWATWGTAGGDLGDAVTFPIPLASALDASHVHFIPVGGTVPSACAGGTPTSPQATSGNLCVYETSESQTTEMFLYASGTGLEGASSTGFGDWYSTTGSGSAFAYGTWAVTG